MPAPECGNFSIIFSARLGEDDMPWARSPERAEKREHDVQGRRRVDGKPEG